MTRENIVAKVIEIIMPFLNMGEESIHKISEEDTLIGELGIDSISLIRIIIEVEQIFDIEIEDNHITLELVKTVGTFADYIYDELSKKTV